MITLFDNDQILDAFAREKVELGRAEGIAEGNRSQALNDARNFLREGVPADIVARATGLPLDEVNALK